MGDAIARARMEGERPRALRVGEEEVEDGEVEDGEVQRGTEEVTHSDAVDDRDEEEEEEEVAGGGRVSPDSNDLAVVQANLNQLMTMRDEMEENDLASRDFDQILREERDIIREQREILRLMQEQSRVESEASTIMRDMISNLELVQRNRNELTDMIEDGSWNDDDDDDNNDVSGDRYAIDESVLVDSEVEEEVEEEEVEEEEVDVVEVGVEAEENDDFSCDS